MRPIAEEPNNWHRVRRRDIQGAQAMRGDPAYLNGCVYVNRVTNQVIEEAQYQQLLAAWELSVNVVELKERKHEGRTS